MSDVAIRVDGLSKRYRLGERQPYKALRDTLAEAATAPARAVRRVRSAGSLNSEGSVWALRDVSFEVKRGQVVGIIGRNGAGKSTLLKILSRITEPSEGVVDIWGRVGSLLEVGTGFHPELTGRENIYLNGAILGLSRRDIDNRFDAIVDFAEVERFIDTPVKRYSTGMHMRLAFAVAAHLEPDILVVDEVLAVGDAQFQRKCLGKISDVARGGRTVCFVSHNMAAIQSLCTQGLLLSSGRIAVFGSTPAAIEAYMRLGSAYEIGAPADLTDLVRTAGNGSIRLLHAATRTITGTAIGSFAVWEPIVLEFTAHAPAGRERATFWLIARSTSGTQVLSSFMYDNNEPVRLGSDPITVRVTIDPNPLVPGLYSFSLGAFDGRREMADWVDDCVGVEVRPEFDGGRAFDHRIGETTYKYEWRTDPCSS